MQTSPEGLVARATNRSVPGPFGPRSAPRTSRSAPRVTRRAATTACRSGERRPSSGRRSDSGRPRTRPRCRPSSSLSLSFDVLAPVHVPATQDVAVLRDAPSVRRAAAPRDERRRDAIAPIFFIVRSFEFRDRDTAGCRPAGRRPQSDIGRRPERSRSSARPSPSSRSPGSSCSRVFLAGSLLVAAAGSGRRRRSATHASSRFSPARGSSSRRVARRRCSTATRAALAALDRIVQERVLGERVVRVKLWTRDGRIVYSDEPRLIGSRYPARRRRSSRCCRPVRRARS